MARQISLVQQVQIASPCPASWDAMTGDNQVRFCHQCKLNVYNLSAMTAEEGERLIREKEGRICARIYRRTDGTVLTQDCPVGLAALKRKARLVLAKIAAAVVFVAGGITLARTDVPKSSRRYSLAQLEPIASINRWLDAQAPIQNRSRLALAGRMSMPLSGTLPFSNHIPPPFTPDQIKTLSREESRLRLSELSKAIQIGSIDADTKKRLLVEWRLVRDYMRDRPKEKQ